MLSEVYLVIYCDNINNIIYYDNKINLILNNNGYSEVIL